MLQHIEKNLIIAERHPNSSGYTWTLASRLGDMLHMAEELFGPRDYSYTILGIDFVSDNPGTWLAGNRRHIIIQLNFLAAADMSQACYQLAHETVHLLAPSDRSNVNNFEEGVACYFAAYYMKRKFNQPLWRPSLPSYERALAVIKPCLDEDIYCIRRLREHQPSFEDITKEEISAEFPNLKSKEVDFLVRKFDQGLGN